MAFLSPENFTFFGQLTLSVFLGALIGLERKLAGKQAGTRTFSFVSLGATLFTIVSVHALEFIRVPGIVQFDPTRVAAQIVTGVGFIGAGIIIFEQSKLKGVTTAASLWLASAIGTAVGFGMYAIAIFTTILAVLVLVIFWVLEERVIEKLPGYRADGER